MKTRRIIICSLSLVVIAALTFLVSDVLVKGDNTATLTQSEVSSLRAVYPVVQGATPVTEVKTPTLNWVAANVDTFVYGKVTGEKSGYSISLDSGNETLAEKNQTEGFEETARFFTYFIDIISDSEGILEPNTRISISASVLFEELFPLLHDGDMIVVPVQKDPAGNGREYQMINVGLYYVTPDGYVLSAFDEPADKTLSGIKTDALLKQLSEVRHQKD